jgi:hypothetical protein
MDALDNLLAAVPLLRRPGGARLTHPMAMPILLPTPVDRRDLSVLFAALAEGWSVDLPTEPDLEPTPLPEPATTALVRRTTTRRRRRR